MKKVSDTVDYQNDSYQYGYYYDGTIFTIKEEIDDDINNDINFITIKEEINDYLNDIMM